MCWQDQTDSKTLSYIVLFLVFINVCLAIGWGISQWNGKRREMRSRMLVLQILTHELRTPIASLGLTVEGFRRQFEALPESLYDEFRRLCEDSRRLRQLAEASKDYLQSMIKVSQQIGYRLLKNGSAIVVWSILNQLNLR